MKRFILCLLTMLIATTLFAKEITYNFSEINSEDVILKVNNSQSGSTKKLNVSDKGITLFAENKFEEHPSTVSVIFIEPLKIDNISDFKTIQLDYTSFRYVSGITLVFEDYEGKKINKFIGYTNLLDGDAKLEWTNPFYIEDVRERNPILKPLYPFNQTDLFLTEIKFHLNDGKYNVQRIKSIRIVYDMANLSGEDLVIDLDEQFGINAAISEKRKARSDKLRAEKKAAEDMEKALMATEE